MKPFMSMERSYYNLTLLSFCRWLGTFIAIAQCFWQYGFYPADYHFMESPMALVLYFLAEAADLSYYVAYTNIKQREKSKLT